jgi:hypothetical protein
VKNEGERDLIAAIRVMIKDQHTAQSKYELFSIALSSKCTRLYSSTTFFFKSSNKCLFNVFNLGTFSSIDKRKE